MIFWAIERLSPAKAKAKVQAILRRNSRDLQKAGEEMLNEWMQKNGFENTSAAIDRLVHMHELGRREELREDGHAGHEEGEDDQGLDQKGDAMGACLATLGPGGGGRVPHL